VEFSRYEDEAEFYRSLAGPYAAKDLTVVDQFAGLNIRGSGGETDETEQFLEGGIGSISSRRDAAEATEDGWRTARLHLHA
jgi:hypothetical protein